MIGLFLVVHVPDPSDERGVPLASRPSDRVVLRFECAEDMVGVVLDGIVIDVAPPSRPLGRAST